MLDEWETRSPGRRQVIFRALMNVRPSHLLDRELFDFSGLLAPEPTGIAGAVPVLRDPGPGH